MPASLIRITRPLTDDERIEVRRRDRYSRLFPGATMSTLLLAGSASVGLLGGLTGAVIGCAVGLGVAVWLFASDRSLGRAFQARLDRDLERGVVEILEIDGVDDDEVQAVSPAHSAVYPAFLLDLPENHSLVLLGEWLCDPTIYGGTDEHLAYDEEEAEEYAALPPPLAFPARAFAIHRLPESGNVLRVELRGDYCRPRGSNEGHDLTGINDMESRLVDCPTTEFERYLDNVSGPA
ncbi:MAG: hypothetical protein NXI31_24635 [bacterium]|nr:hypothetical protein [bacterium]